MKNFPSKILINSSCILIVCEKRKKKFFSIFSNKNQLLKCAHFWNECLKLIRLIKIIPNKWEEEEEVYAE